MNQRRHKVCILTTSHEAGDDRIRKQSLSLARCGYHVFLVARQPEEALPDGVLLVALPRAQSKFGRLVANCTRALWLAVRMRADVYHLHDPELVPAGLILRLLGKKVIYDAHEDYQQQLRAKRIPAVLRSMLARCWWGLEKTASRLFNHVIAADSYIRDKFPPHRATTIGNFPPLSFGDVPRSAAATGGFRMVYAGLISAARGLPQVLAACDLLKIDGVQLHVAGWSSDTGLLDSLSRHPKVVYRGQMPWSDINAYLANFDLGLLLLQPVAGYVNCTGEGIIKLFEYMSVGLPVLISNFPKLKELIESLQSGVAVDPTSPEEIAKAIEYLYQNPAVRCKMGENGRRAVRKRFNWEHEEQKLLEIYDTVLSGKKR